MNERKRLLNERKILNEREILNEKEKQKERYIDRMNERKKETH